MSLNRVLDNLVFQALRVRVRTTRFPEIRHLRKCVEQQTGTGIDGTSRFRIRSASNSDSGKLDTETRVGFLQLANPVHFRPANASRPKVVGPRHLAPGKKISAQAGLPKLDQLLLLFRTCGLQRDAVEFVPALSRNEFRASIAPGCHASFREKHCNMDGNGTLWISSSPPPLSIQLVRLSVASWWVLFTVKYSSPAEQLCFPTEFVSCQRSRASSLSRLLPGVRGQKTRAVKTVISRVTRNFREFRHHDFRSATMKPRATHVLDEHADKKTQRTEQTASPRSGV